MHNACTYRVPSRETLTRILEWHRCLPVDLFRSFGKRCLFATALIRLAVDGEAFTANQSFFNAAVRGRLE